VSRYRSIVGNNGLQNLNGNVLCVLDCETTGLQAGYHDLCEIAVVPLDAKLERMQGVPIFNVMLQLKRPQNLDPGAMKINGIDLTELQINGIEPWGAASMFERWFDDLGLAPGKKISPLAKNWPFDRGFIQDWLGRTTFEHIFHHQHRDLQPVALFLNDRAEFQIQQIPFPKARLVDLAEKLGVKMDRAHRAVDDALATAECYKKLMTVFIK
jgi:DNA polymerase III epsilon subunit-like protein